VPCLLSVEWTNDSVTCATRVALLWPGSVSKAKGRAVLPVYRGGVKRCSGIVLSWRHQTAPVAPVYPVGQVERYHFYGASARLFHPGACSPLEQGNDEPEQEGELQQQQQQEL